MIRKILSINQIAVFQIGKPMKKTQSECFWISCYDVVESHHVDADPFFGLVRDILELEK